MRLKIVLIGVILIVLSLFIYFDIASYLSLSTLKEFYTGLLNLYQKRPLFFILCYLLTYIVTTSFSLPGATILTIAAGAIFKLYLGTILAIIGSTIGATLSFLLSRILLRSYISKRFAIEYRKVSDHLNNEGRVYLLSLRLLPIFPFWLINLLMGITNIDIRSYIIFSFIGMLPAAIIYVNAGTTLSMINSLSDILTIRVFITLSLFALLPPLARLILRKYQK